jgi:hypothetical protein
VEEKRRRVVDILYVDADRGRVIPHRVSRIFSLS